MLILHLFLVLLDALGSIIELFLKLGELLIIKFSDMESHRNKIKGIDLLGIIIILKIHEQGLFVGEIPVVSQMIMYFEIIGSVLVRFYLIS